MIADRVRMRKIDKKGIPDYYVMATDADFSGTADGDFVYIGSDDYVIIPHKIKGVTVTRMTNGFGAMFSQNYGIRGVATLEENSITNMAAMFYDSQATSLDLSSFNTSNVTNMNGMFEGSQATTLDLSSFNTSNVTDMNNMFSNSKATILDLSSFDTSKVTYMGYMFYGSKATTLDLSNFDTSNVTNMNNMFSNSLVTTCYARTQADVNKFNAIYPKPSGLRFVVK